MKEHNNINDTFNSFYKTFTEILDQHAPLIKIIMLENLDKQRNPISHVEKR